MVKKMGKDAAWKIGECKSVKGMSVTVCRTDMNTLNAFGTKEELKKAYYKYKDIYDCKIKRDRQRYMEMKI
jgi:hypothetical protein